MKPCSLCGYRGVNRYCGACERREPRFLALPREKRLELTRSDATRPPTQFDKVAALVSIRYEKLTTLGRPPLIALVGCGKAKLNVRAPAKNLYIGNLFHAALRHAEATADETYIVSGAHGLVDLERVLMPYERHIRTLRPTERTEWGYGVVSSLVAMFPMIRINLCIYASSMYAKPIIQAVADQGTAWGINLPLEGLMLGERLRWFSERRNACSDYDSETSKL